MNQLQDNQLEQQKAIWNRYAKGWKKWDDLMKVEMRLINDELIKLLRLKGNEHILDVASGTGEPGLSLSTLLPKGTVTAIDLSEQMVAIANEYARQRHIVNYKSQAHEVLAMPFKDNFFDHVICRFGIMFFPDLQVGINEMARVLKPGGTLTVVVWAGPDSNPFIALLGKVVTEKLQMPKPPPDAPGVFRCAKPGFARQLFTQARLVEIKEQLVNGKMAYDSVEQYWEMSSDVAGPIMTFLKDAPDTVIDDIKNTIFSWAEHFREDDKLRLGWEAILVSGIKNKG